jgi:large repetitive protein
VSHSYTTTGSYTVRVTARNRVGAANAETTIQIAPAPAADQPIVGLTATSDESTVVDQSLHLTATVSSGTNVIYTWGLGDDPTMIGDRITHRYAAPGVYTVRVTARNSAGEATTTVAVQVQPASPSDTPISGLLATNDSPTVVGTPTRLTAGITAGSNVRYQWDFGDGSTGDGESIEHRYAAPGVYTARVVAQNGVNRAEATTVVIVQTNTDDELPDGQDLPMRLFLPLVTR